MTGGTRNHPERAADGGSAIACFAVLASACGYFVMVVIHRPPLAAMVSGSLLATGLRAELLRSMVFWSLTSAVLMAAILHLARRRRGWPTSLRELVAVFWPLTLLPLCWYAFDITVWSASPVLLYAVTTVACGICVIRTEVPWGRPRWTIPPAFRRHLPTIVLTAAVVAYVIYVSLQTILNHRSLGTAAYDLGIHENTLWNTLHGRFFFSSLEGGSHLGVHTSFIMLLMVPIYALAPFTETVLVIQTLVLALAAVPLYLLAKKVLESDLQALALALLWLSHPAVAGANFYDFHAVSFAPVVLFTTAYFWWCGRWRPFWLSVVLLLSVKEDMAILVVLLGVVALLEGDRRRGGLLVTAGVAAYLVLQHLVIPHYAGGEHSYAWYYTEMIPVGEGPAGLVTTAVLNPLHTVSVALTQERLLFVFQLFAPLAFLPFLTARGALLVSYGLAATVLATRPPLHQIGFQYALIVLAPAFLAAVIALKRFDPEWRRRGLAAAVMLAVVTCFHYGVIWPRHHFTGGFHTIDFDYTEADRDRYDELHRLVEKIPVDATVLASENLVPHLARREIVETERLVQPVHPTGFDCILVHNDGSAERVRQNRSLGVLRNHDVEHTPHFVLFTRRPGNG